MARDSLRRNLVAILSRSIGMVMSKSSLTGGSFAWPLEWPFFVWPLTGAALFSNSDDVALLAASTALPFSPTPSQPTQRGASVRRASSKAWPTKMTQPSAKKLLRSGDRRGDE